MRIRLILLLALLGVLLPTQLEAAPTGAPEATVTTASLNGSITNFSNCEDHSNVLVNSASIAVIRTGSTGQPLSVDVAYGGTLIPGTDYPVQPDPVTIEPGSDGAFLTIPASTPGTVTLTVEPGTGYTPGAPATTTAEIVELPFTTECPAAEVQTIALRETPTPIDVYGRYGSFLADSVVEISGDVPPGLTFNNDGSFSGTATELGTFSFTASYCVGACALVLPVTINVVPVDSPLPAPAPPPSGTSPANPATPVAGQSNFTG